MSYELWSHTSRNLMHSFETEIEAIETARTCLAAGDVSTGSLAIVAYNEDDIPASSVSVAELAALVHDFELGRRSA